MRAVLDTNVFVSATLIQSGTEDKILRKWKSGEFELVVSSQILKEIGRVLSYKKFLKYFRMTQEELVLFLQMLSEESIFVEGKSKIEICRDPDDNKFIDAAMEGRANYIVSGDKDLLILKNYKGISIISPAKFLKKFKSKQ